ncbi:unnamed protein product [Sphagnum troendelagicum]|uniref:Protein kinase domain-containing protein n=1 Tax=Sphagnum troendelagicum TaxID=128251 RepID=A0ABP0U3Z1_9BRYO
MLIKIHIIYFFLLLLLLLLLPLGSSSGPSSLEGNETLAMQSLRQVLQVQESAWPGSQDPCIWRGVQCFNGHVDTLLLTGLPHSEPTLQMLSALVELPYLRILNATQVLFQGPIPEWIGNLSSSLETLDLTACELNGLLPMSLGNLWQLSYLSLANNFLNTSLPPELGNLTQLTQLDLSNNAFWGPIPAELGKLVHLTTLSLSRNNLSGSIPPEISQCGNLQILTLDRNNISGEVPETLESLKSLTILDLSFNAFMGLFPLGFLSMQSLQSLDLMHNAFYGPIPQQLVSLENLQSLSASSNFFNETLPMGLNPNATMKRNCLTDAIMQHSLRVCIRFYAQLGVVFLGYNMSANQEALPPVAACPIGSILILHPGGNKLQYLAPVLASIFGGLCLILFVGVMLVCLRKHQRSNQARRDSSLEAAGAIQISSHAGEISSARRWGETFTYTQLQTATKSFAVANLIAEGHSGDLYIGLLDGGVSVVVKRIDLNKVKRELYLAELEVFARTSHTRLISLLGHSLDRDREKFLVYKHSANRDLATALHKKGSPGPCEDLLLSLDWITRLKIAIGVAEGLAYLHSECSPSIVHRDIRASSILLDDKYEVRIASFSEARIQDGDHSHSNIITRFLGFSNFMLSGGAMVSCANDVFCFGKVLMELISGKLGISGGMDPSANQWLEWALPLINVHDKDSLPKIVDPSLIVDEDLFEEVWAMAIIAKACLNAKPTKRPSMAHILKALENPHKVVREEHFGEALTARTSSHGSWNEVLFGSWRHNHNSNAGGPREDLVGSLALPESSRLHHARRGSSDIAPEPIQEVPNEVD